METIHAEGEVGIRSEKGIVTIFINKGNLGFTIQILIQKHNVQLWGIYAEKEKGIELLDWVWLCVKHVGM